MNSKEFFYNLGRAIYHIDSLYDDFAKSSGVSPTLLWILYALNDSKPHTQRDICLDWGLPKSTVNTVVTELKNNGYVTLKKVEGTRREMTVLLTDTGKIFADKVLANIYSKEAEVFNLLNSSDLELPRALNKITELLKK